MVAIATAIQKAQTKQNPSIPMQIEPLLNESVSAKPTALQCPKCGGSQYVRLDVPRNHPSFGRVFACSACNMEALTFSAGLNPQERTIRLADLDTDGRPGAEAMVRAMGQFLADGCYGFLTIHGGYGNGKSTALKAIVNACIERGIEARYVTMTEVMIYAREAFESQQQGDSDYGRIAKLAKVCVLVIDELDKARITDYAREVQTHLFDIRYREAHRLGTVVAWNGRFRDIDMPWVLSRLSEYPVIENKDTDMRPLLGGER